MVFLGIRIKMLLSKLFIEEKTLKRLLNEMGDLQERLLCCLEYNIRILSRLGFRICVIGCLKLYFCDLKVAIALVCLSFN